MKGGRFSFSRSKKADRHIDEPKRQRDGLNLSRHGPGYQTDSEQQVAAKRLRPVPDLTYVVGVHQRVLSIGEHLEVQNPLGIVHHHPIDVRSWSPPGVQPYDIRSAHSSCYRTLCIFPSAFFPIGSQFRLFTPAMGSLHIPGRRG